MKYLLGILAVALLGMGLAFMLTSGEGKKQAWRPGEPLPVERVKIGVLYLSDPSKETSGYTCSHEAGIRAMQRELGISDSQIIRKMNVSDSDAAAATHVMLECIMAGANIIIATSFNYMEASASLAAQYPNVVFATVGVQERNSANFSIYYGRMYQAKYLGGVIAGLRTRSNKIGYVAAMDKENFLVTSAVNAFALGVESVNPKARVHLKVTHRWFDPEGEREAAWTLILNGCDVIAQYCNTPNPQIMASEAGVWGLGYSSDMQYAAPDAVITSMIWNWGVYYTDLVRSVIDGSFFPEFHLGDLRDGLVELAPFNQPLLPAGAASMVASARERIESGEFRVFEGTLRTNDGQIIGREGRRWSDNEMMDNMRWYYHNIVEVE